MLKCSGVGRLATDPTVRTTESGVKYATYRIAVWRDKNNTDFYSCITWRNNAEFAEKWMHKGTQIFFDGHLEPDEYTAKDGVKRSSVRIVIDNTEFTGGKTEPAKQETATGFTEETPQNLPF